MRAGATRYSNSMSKTDFGGKRTPLSAAAANRARRKRAYPVGLPDERGNQKLISGQAETVGLFRNFLFLRNLEQLVDAVPVSAGAGDLQRSLDCGPGDFRTRKAVRIIGKDF